MVQGQTAVTDQGSWGGNGMLQVPIVASTGGLVDTVKEGFTGFHMGAAFNVDVSNNFSCRLWIKLAIPS